MIWSVSWRNVWRNKRRSGVLLVAICIGVFAGLFSMAFIKGLANQRLQSAIMTEVSHIQIHNKEFVDVNTIEHFFSGSNEMESQLEKIPGVISASQRIELNAILNSAQSGVGIRLIGVHPEKEAMVTNLHEKIIEGSYLETMKRGKPALIGQKLAEKLEVKIGSKVIVGSLDLNGSPLYYQFRVSGIFKTSSTPFDEGTVFVRNEDLREVTALPENVAHEMALLLENREISARLGSDIQALYPDLSVRTWDQVMPELGYLTETMDYMMYVFILIILLALGFGIVNTMLMVVLERVKELGMLMAVGMNRKRIFLMILLESVFLCVTGGAAGIIMGSLFAGFFSYRGMDLSAFYGEGLSSIGYDSVIFPEVTLEMILSVVLLVILTGMISSLYPAFKARKLSPVEAIRTDI